MIVLSGDFRSWSLDASATMVTIGVFDGVHRGHQYVLKTLAADAGDRPLVVATFSTHPAGVVRPERAPRLLTSLPQRLELLEEHGVDVAAVFDFDDRMRRMAAPDFVGAVLIDTLHAETVAIGADFRFGYELGGDVALLETLGEGFGFTVRGLPILEDPVPIRSTAIRAALGAGDVAAAAALLGRPFQVRGVVLRGDRRGHTIGFPTANLELPHALARPRWGVYTARAGIGSANRPAVVNVGVRPTIGGERELIEVHLLDGDADLYDQVLHVDFVDRIRDERRFENLEALVAQISLDADEARRRLGAGT